MRSPAAYYLMLLYITVVIKPLIPFIQDEWAHQFNEIEHISTIHAKYGSNHLEKDLAGTDTGNDKGKNQSALKTEDQVSFHELTQKNEHHLVENKLSIEYPSVTLRSLPIILILKQGQPPKFS